MKRFGVGHWAWWPCGLLNLRRTKPWVSWKIATIISRLKVSGASLYSLSICFDQQYPDYKFEQVEEAPPPTVDDDIRRKEEEELQRVLEMSIQDKGGRGQWAQYSLASDSSPSAAGASSSSASRPSESSSTHPFAAPKYSGGGYVPARTPSPARVAAQQRQQAAYYQQAQQKYNSSTASSVAESTAPTIAAAVAPTPAPAQAAPPTAAAAPAPAPQQQPAAATPMNIVTRVRALHTFEPTEPGELAFEKGDIIKVVDRGYKDWWRGQLKGRTGIFPVNYVVCS